MHALLHPRSGSPAFTVAAGAVAATTPWLLDLPWSGRVLLSLVLAVGAVTAGIDVDTGRLPDRLVGLCGIGSAMLVVSEAVAGRGPAAAVGAVAGALAFAGPLLVVHLVAPGAMGFGDVKFAAALGLGLGVVDPVVSVLALCLACGVSVVAAALAGRPKVPFGPGLVLGAAVALLPTALASSGARPWP